MELRGLCSGQVAGTFITGDGGFTVKTPAKVGLRHLFCKGYGRGQDWEEGSGLCLPFFKFNCFSGEPSYLSHSEEKVQSRAQRSKIRHVLRILDTTLRHQDSPAG